MNIFVRFWTVTLLCFSLLGGSVFAATKTEVAQAQRMLNALDHPAGVVDGLWGGTTRRALEQFLNNTENSFDGALDQLELELLEDAMLEQGLSVFPAVDWKYRATSIGFGGYDRADQPVYDAISAIREIPAYGFNVVTLDIRCVGKIEISAPSYYPLGRKIGCSIPNKQILDEEGFVSSRRDATDLAIDEARAVNLAVNLKPMFLELGRRYGTKDAAGYGEVPLEIFFNGDGSEWSGYVPVILSMARYAQENQIEYLTIGTELNNLNDRVEADERWPEIIEKIRAIYDGQLIYSHNYNNDSDLKRISSSNIMRLVDIVGVNYFPSRIMGGRTDYTAEEVSIMLRRATLKNGRNMMHELEVFQADMDVPIILSETHFPTWEGSANWIFRGGCDYQNEGRSGWEFTQGPLQAKTPSPEHGRTLAQGFMLAFEDEEWVFGADYLYWTVSHAYDERTDRQEYGPCSSWLWEKDNGIKEMIRDFHGQ